MGRRIVIAAGIGVALAAGGGAGWMRLHRAPSPRCVDPQHALAGVWDPAIKAKARAAFAATKKPYAERANTAVTTALDGYVAEWSTAVVGNCRATEHVEQPPPVGALRQLCLDQRFEEARALAQMLQDPTTSLLDKADTAVWELDAVSSCADPATLIPQDIEPRYRADYARLLLQAATAHAQAVGGQLVAAEGALMHVTDEGRRIHANDLVALALHARAAVLFGEGRLDEAYQVASEAVSTAMLARRDDLLISAALTVASARAEGAAQGNLDVASGWLNLASAAIGRAGGVGRQFHERRLELIGVIAAQRGDLQTAIAAHEQALATATERWGNANPRLWAAEVQLATTLARSGAWAKALPHFEHARELREAAVGPDHPDVALLLSNLAPCYQHSGDPAKALLMVKRALQIREKTYGATSPFLVPTLDNLADVELRNHELAGALADIERARTIAIRFPGKLSPPYHTVATTRAEILGAAGRVAEARTAFDEVLALEDQTRSPELATTLAARATLELAQTRWTDAAEFEERAIAAYEASGGREDLSLWKPLAGLAQARRALDPKAVVKPLLDRALALGIKAQLAPDELDPIRAQLASL